MPHTSLNFVLYPRAPYFHLDLPTTVSPAEEAMADTHTQGLTVPGHPKSSHLAFGVGMIGFCAVSTVPPLSLYTPDPQWAGPSPGTVTSVLPIC